MYVVGLVRSVAHSGLVSIEFGVWGTSVHKGSGNGIDNSIVGVDSRNVSTVALSVPLSVGDVSRKARVHVRGANRLVNIAVSVGHSRGITVGCSGRVVTVRVVQTSIIVVHRIPKSIALRVNR